MAETWPLPYQILQSGFNQQATDNRIRSKVEAGVDKLRKRYTTPIKNINASMHLTYAQYDTLETFFNTTLQGGVLTFNYPDPTHQGDVTPTMYEYRFLSTPTYSAAGGTHYVVTMNWERIT